MSSNTVIAPPTAVYSLEILREEANQLVHKGVISRQQPIYILCQYIPAREWVLVECELERSNYLLRDPIGDLIGHECWRDD